MLSIDGVQCMPCVDSLIIHLTLSIFHLPNMFCCEAMLLSLKSKMALFCQYKTLNADANAYITVQSFFRSRFNFFSIST